VYIYEPVPMCGSIQQLFRNDAASSIPIIETLVANGSE